MYYSFCQHLSQPNNIVQATPRIGADVLQLRQPHSVLSAYNKCMGGDLNDQKVVEVLILVPDKLSYCEFIHHIQTNHKKN